jgi:hypothetical protein
MYQSKYLLYIFFNGRSYKIGLVVLRENLDRRFNHLFKGLQQSDASIRDKVCFARVYEAKTDRMIKTCEANVLKELEEYRIPDFKGYLTESFDDTVSLDDILECISKQTRCKLNLLYEDYIPNEK